jgi:hypothetical protein
MASLAISPPCSSAQASLNPETPWIAPKEQLYQLALPIAEKLVDENRNKLAELIFLERSIIECAARVILRRSDLSDKESEKQIPSLKDLAVEQLLNPNPLPSHLTTWYKALKRIDKLPEKVPPLPGHILEILNKPCPKKICSTMKSEGTPFTVGEKCTLILIPQELGNPDEFEKVIKSYGDIHYPEYENPLQYQYFWDEAREQHGKTPFGPTCWILHTNDVLEGSRNKSWDQQTAMVNALAKETLVNWQVPESFAETFLTIALTEIGTGKRLYQMASEQNGYLSTYARSKEMTQGYHLVVGGSSPSGVSVDCNYDYVIGNIGVAARRKF